MFMVIVPQEYQQNSGWSEPSASLHCIEAVGLHLAHDLVQLKFNRGAAFGVVAGDVRLLVRRIARCG
jgi:hypothetical protein